MRSGIPRFVTFVTNEWTTFTITPGDGQTTRIGGSQAILSIQMAQPPSAPNWFQTQRDRFYRHCLDYDKFKCASIRTTIWPLEPKAVSTIAKQLVQANSIQGSVGTDNLLATITNATSELVSNWQGKLAVEPRDSMAKLNAGWQPEPDVDGLYDLTTAPQVRISRRGRGISMKSRPWALYWAAANVGQSENYRMGRARWDDTLLYGTSGFGGPQWNNNVFFGHNIFHLDTNLSNLTTFRVKTQIVWKFARPRYRSIIAFPPRPNQSGSTLVLNPEVNILESAALRGGSEPDGEVPDAQPDVDEVVSVGGSVDESEADFIEEKKAE